MNVKRSAASVWLVGLLGTVAAACGSSGTSTNPAIGAGSPPPAGAGTGAVGVVGGGSSGTGTAAVGGLSSTGGAGALAVNSAGHSGAAGIATSAGASGGSAGSAGSAGIVATGGSSGAAGVAGAAGGGAGSSSNGNCGMRTGMRGKTSRTVMVSGTNRTYIAYLPQAASPNTALPFVYVFHGAEQTGSQLYDMTEYSKLADTENIAVVFPDGQDVSSATNTGSLTPWSISDGPATCGYGGLVGNPNPVDFPFVDAIKTDIEQDQCLDDAHIFATGFSMGGYFTHHIACDRPDFRAAAPHSGATMADLTSCKTTHMPIVIFHGTADPLIVPGCDDPNSDPQAGFPASATLWAAKNGCKATYTTMPAMGTGGMDGQCYLYDGCPADGQVELCTFNNLEHAWAGATSCENCIGSGMGYASATQIQWDFFKKYAW
jgi:poly(3-hydroxybutyrate) depolymerase